MRLPWPFGRRTPSDGQPSSTPEDGRDGASSPGASSPGASSDAAVAAEVPRVAPATGAWATLPPIQRTAGGPPLVAPAAPFLAGVPGHRPLPPIIQPLGHEAGPSAPPGLVVAHVSTVPSLTSRAPMPGRPVQRRATEPAPDALDASAWSRGPVEAGQPASSRPAAGTSSGPVADAGAVGHGAPAVTASTPIRKLAAVAPTATVTPAARPLTLAPEPVATVRRSSGSAGIPSAAAIPSGRPATTSLAAPGASLAGRGSTTPPARGTGPGRTVSRWAEASTSGAATPPIGLGAPRSSSEGLPSAGDLGESATTAASGPGAHVSPTPGTQPALTAASRRAGLGAPLATPPASAVAQRLPASGLPARSGAPADQPTADPPAASSAGGSAPSTPGGPRPAARRLPVLPVLHVSRRRPDEPATSASGPAASGPASSGSAAASGAPVAGHAHAALAVTPATGSGSGAAATSSGPGTSMRPTMGLRPLRTRVSAQREAADASSASGDAASVPARWPSGDDLPATVRSVAPSPERAPDADAVPLQRLADLPSASTLASQAAPTAQDIVFPPRGASPAASRGSSSGTGATPGIDAVQRQAEHGAGSDSPSLQRSPSNLTGGGRRASGATPRGDLTLVRPPVPGAIVASPSAAAPVVARIVAGPASPAAAPTVQASGASSGGTPAGGITATPVVQRVDGAASAAPSEEGRSESELDELARALFGRIRTHLRAEVIHEREAKGLTFDAF